MIHNTAIKSNIWIFNLSTSCNFWFDLVMLNDILNVHNNMPLLQHILYLLWTSDQISMRIHLPKCQVDKFGRAVVCSNSADSVSLHI